MEIDAVGTDSVPTVNPVEAGCHMIRAFTPDPWPRIRARLAGYQLSSPRCGRVQPRWLADPVRQALCAREACAVWSPMQGIGVERHEKCAHFEVLCRANAHIGVTSVSSVRGTGETTLRQKALGVCRRQT